MSNKRAVETLGMSHGAACNRLRKMVLFRQLKKYGDNICVRCNKEIENIEELSIEHIKPWEGRSAELFWDLDNVAFSHLKCNTPHQRGGKPSFRRIETPDGMSWCRTHKQFLPEDKFSKHNQTWNGIKRDCKECEKKYKDRIRYGKVSEDSADGLQTVSNTVPS
jgi:hypothetical protein